MCGSNKFEFYTVLTRYVMTSSLSACNTKGNIVFRPFTFLHFSTPKYFREYWTIPGYAHDLDIG